jgi:hypothetical protein
MSPNMMLANKPSWDNLSPKLGMLLQLLAIALSGSLAIVVRALLFKKQVAKRKDIKMISNKIAVAETPAKVTDRGELDLRRKWAIVSAGATDHAGEVTVVDGQQDLSKTIFHAMSGVKAMVMRGTVCVELYWSDAAIQRITKCFADVPRSPDHNQCILDFMENDCDFKMEHADGSFMDHLQFCYEYGNAHFQQHSPRVLFLHSIMGVGSNVFPMSVDKEPKLRAMLTDEEYVHIQAFPSMLRLLYTRDLIIELKKNMSRLDKLESISFHRVIDNKEMSLTAEELWVQLNYQVCHQLDFLPVSNWLALKSNAFLTVFIDIYDFLAASKRLRAEVNFDLTSGENSSHGLPLTLGCLLTQVIPERVAQSLKVKQMKENSSKIGHSLDYTLRWEE